MPIRSSRQLPRQGDAVTPAPSSALGQNYAPAAVGSTICPINLQRDPCGTLSRRSLPLRTNVLCSSTQWSSTSSTASGSPASSTGCATPRTRYAANFCLLVIRKVNWTHSIGDALLILTVLEPGTSRGRSRGRTGPDRTGQESVWDVLMYHAQCRANIPAQTFQSLPHFQMTPGLAPSARPSMRAHTHTWPAQALHFWAAPPVAAAANQFVSSRCAAVQQLGHASCASSARSQAAWHINGVGGGGAGGV